MPLLPLRAVNFITPLRAMGVGELSVDEDCQVAPWLAPLCGVPKGFESTMTFPTGGASKLNRSTIDVAATRLVLAPPTENPTPVVAARHEPSLNGSLPPFHASPRVLPPLPAVGTSTRAAAPVAMSV